VRPAEIELIHNTYVQVAASGKGLAEQHDKLRTLAQAPVSRDGVDTILLAGTDLTLLFNETNTDFPHIDCAALHIEAILKRLAIASADSL
jgi:aspartate racemase